MRGELTEADKKLLDDVAAEMKVRIDKFFDHFGVVGEERALARREHMIFVQEFMQAGMGHGFFNSPLAMKAFMVGYFRGRKSCSEMK